LPQQIHLPVLDQRRITRIRQYGIQRLDQAQPPIGLSQQQDTAVTGDISTGKVGFDLSAIKAWKTQFGLRTLWH